MGLRIDNKEGVGSVPMNNNVGYLGLRVRMRPSVFLLLTRPLADTGAGSHVERRVRGLMDLMEKGVAFGAPFLEIAIPPGWYDEDEEDFSEIPRVVAHEGRHRMLAAQKLYGDEPVEVHLFPVNFRARDITPKWIALWNTALVRQGKKDDAVRGPLFKVMP